MTSRSGTAWRWTRQHETVRLVDADFILAYLLMPSGLIFGNMMYTQRAGRTASLLSVKVEEQMFGKVERLTLKWDQGKSR